MPSSCNSWLGLALFGCNSVFDLRATTEQDAAFFDAPIDAPYECPDIGQTPSFDPTLHQYMRQDCADFQLTSNGRAIGYCRHAPFGIYEGPASGPLTPVAQLTGFDLQPRISPDGQRLLVRKKLGAVDYVVHDFARAADGTWTNLGDAPFTQSISTIALGATGYFVLVENAEWIDDGTGWRDTTRRHPFGTDANAVTLTADGLRALLFEASSFPHTRFSDRADTSGIFRIAEGMPGFSERGVAFAHMTNDCARAYMTGLGYVFYIQQ